MFEENPLFTPDNKFVTGRGNGHVHGNLRALVGAADYALYVKDPVLFGRIDALYRYVRSQGTRFGFLPEVVGRKGDVISCETCALMDFVGLGVTLANNGHPEYWGDVERMVRNQLLENQVADASWAEKGSAEKGQTPFPRTPCGPFRQKVPTPFPPDTDQFTCARWAERMVGGYAGWSSPTHILAAKEYLALGRPRVAEQAAGVSELLRRLRHARLLHCLEELGTVRQRHALGPHALRQAPAGGRGALLSAVPGPGDNRTEAAVQGPRPHPRLRPARRDGRPVGCRQDGDAGKVEAKIFGNYLLLGDRQAGEKLEITYPLPLREETETIGNPGRRQYEYRVTWKGDTVVRMSPVGEGVKAATGYSDFNRKEVEIFFGEPGPGRLYQRQYLLAPTTPQLPPLHQDDGSLDFWLLH